MPFLLSMEIITVCIFIILPLLGDTFAYGASLTKSDNVGIVSSKFHVAWTICNGLENHPENNYVVYIFNWRSF